MGPGALNKEKKQPWAWLMVSSLQPHGLLKQKKKPQTYHYARRMTSKRKKERQLETCT